jgi:hypothetical protein
MSLRLVSFALVLGSATLVAAQPAPAPGTPGAPTAPQQAPAAQPAQPVPSAEPAAPTDVPPATAPAPVYQPPPPPPPPPAELPSALPPTPAPDVTEAPAEAPLATKLNVGSGGGYVQPGLLLQGWFQYDKAKDEDNKNKFRLRRAELGVKGEIVPKLVGYGLVMDFARALEPVDTPITVGTDTATIKQPSGASTVLNDFYITLMSEYVDASLGQFKIPISWEGMNSSSKLIFAERALISRLYGDRRDIGVKLTKNFKYFGYYAGFFNGAGQNVLETVRSKDGTVRLEAYPVDGLTIALAGYSTLMYRKQSGSKDRLEADVRYEHGPILVQAEYIRGIDKPVGGGSGLTGQGFYIAGGYYVLDNLQPVVRVGYVDPNTKANADPTMTKGLVMDEVVTYEVGVNYYISKQEAKLLLNYSRFQYQDAHPNNEVIAGAQVWF